MKLNTHSLLSLVLLLFASNLVGQQLDQLISMGITNNLELRALELDFQAAMQRADQVDVLPDPEIGIGAFPLPVETRLGPQLARVGVSQAFPWLGTLGAKRRLEEDAAKPILKNMDAEVIALTYKIKTEYFNIYEVGSKRDILSEKLKVIRVLENLALSKVESGKTTIADVLRIQSFKEEVQQRLEILDLEKEQLNIKLNTLLNHSVDERIMLDTSMAFR